jgi:hypothetical protein
MKIAHHQGEIITSSFPVENRLLGQVRAADCQQETASASLGMLAVDCACLQVLYTKIAGLWLLWHAFGRGTKCIGFAFLAANSVQ